jgi:hypothetical protein
MAARHGFLFDMAGGYFFRQSSSSSAVQDDTVKVLLKLPAP